MLASFAASETPYLVSLLWTMHLILAGFSIFSTTHRDPDRHGLGNFMFHIFEFQKSTRRDWVADSGEVEISDPTLVGILGNLLVRNDGYL